MNILITGANGGYGTYAIDYLKKFAPTANLFGLVRSEAKGQGLKEKGVHIRIGDYADLDSMKKALIGMDRLLFVSNPVPGLHKNVVEAAKLNGVKYIAYTGIYQPEDPKFGLEINHKETERLLEESGISYTILRNGWYSEINQPLFEFALETKKFPYFSKDAKLTFALKREYAEAGARVISNANYPKILNLTGQPISYQELGVATKTALGTDIDILDVTSDEFQNIIRENKITAQGLSIAQIYQKYALNSDNSEASADPTEFEQVLAHPLTTPVDTIKELLNI